MELSEAKERTLNQIEVGVECPCCGQFAKEYRRKLNSAMALYLIRLCKLTGGYHHISEIGLVTGGGDFAKLKYYGFIEEEINENTAKRTSGVWKLTPEGRAFARNESTVTSHFRIYNSKLLGFSGEQINIIDALGQRFNYEELMLD